MCFKFRKSSYQCHAEYCQKQISSDKYCSKHECRWLNCHEFAYNTGIDPRFCGTHECNFDGCRSRIYNEMYTICIEHMCQKRNCYEPKYGKKESYCQYHSGNNFSDSCSDEGQFVELNLDEE